MGHQASPGSYQSHELERRREGRIYLSIPVVVSWKSQNGSEDEEPAVTEELNSTSGLLKMRRPPPTSAELEILHQASGEGTQARIVRIEDAHKDGMARIAIHYAKHEKLWGVQFPN